VKRVRLTLTLLAASACGGASSDDCELSVGAINGGATEEVGAVSNGADVNGDLPGVQVVVRVDVMGLDEGTTVALEVQHPTGAPSTTEATVAEGQANFPAVDLGNIDGSVTLVPSLPGGRQCAISTHAVVVHTIRCAVTTPLEGEVLNRMDDLDDSTPELLETAVRVATNAPDRSTATLSVAGTPLTARASVLGFTALFEQAILPDMEGVLLEAVVLDGDGNQAACSVTVDVDMGFDSCTLTVPSAAAIGTLGLVLNGADDVDGAPGLQADVLVSTDALTGSSVELFANDQPLATAVFDALGQTTFLAQTLPQGPLVLRAVCRDAAGNELRSPPYPVTVDSVPPDAVDDMSCAVFDRRTASLRCTWTAPLEAGTGLAGYDFRYLTGNFDIDATSFPTAVVATPPVAPVPSGAEQNYVLASDADNLIRLGSSYDVAVLALDAAGNASGLSNGTPRLSPSLNEQSLVGEDGDAYFGLSAAAGDFNCDGIGDLAVGAPDIQSGSPLRPNRVYLYFGGPQGLPNYYDSRILSTRPSNFGSGLTALGNFDGDTMGLSGCDDLAVGANSEGKLYVYLGRPAWFDRTDEDIGTGAELIVAGENAGWSGKIAGGDLNGDGRGDLLYGVHAVPARPLRVQILLGFAATPMEPVGAPVTLSATADADVSIDAGDFQSFGGYLSASDINGDGLDDALIGHYEYDLTPNDNVGAAYVVYGSDPPPATIDVSAPSPDFSLIVGGPNNYEFGWAVNGVGDLDGDGAAELAVGDLFFSTPTSNAGIAYVFTGLEVGMNQSVDDAVWTIGNGTGPGAADDYLGRAFIEGGERLDDAQLDVEQDGFADLVVAETGHGGEVGSVLIYFGGAAGPMGDSNTRADIRLAAPLGASGSFGAALVSVGQPDFNGDGFGDFAVTDATFGSCPGPGMCGRLTVYW